MDTKYLLWDSNIDRVSPVVWSGADRYGELRCGTIWKGAVLKGQFYTDRQVPAGAGIGPAKCGLKRCGWTRCPKGNLEEGHVMAGRGSVELGW